jgi:hypothetical protein
MPRTDYRGLSSAFGTKLNSKVYFAGQFQIPNSADLSKLTLLKSLGPKILPTSSPILLEAAHDRLLFLVEPSGGMDPSRLVYFCFKFSVLEMFDLADPGPRLGEAELYKWK